MNCKKKCLLVAMLTCSVSIFLLFNIVSIIVHARLNNVFYLYIYICVSITHHLRVIVDNFDNRYTRRHKKSGHAVGSFAREIKNAVKN